MMAMIEQELKNLWQLQQQVQNGSADHEMVSSSMQVASQIEKRQKMILQMEILKLKFGKKALNGLVSRGLISDEKEVIDIGVDPGENSIQCPDMDKVITRKTCLDYSGRTENIKTCKTCRNFGHTRKLLLPPERS